MFDFCEERISKTLNIVQPFHFNLLLVIFVIGITPGWDSGVSEMKSSSTAQGPVEHDGGGQMWMFGVQGTGGGAALGPPWAVEWKNLLAELKYVGSMIEHDRV